MKIAIVGDREVSEDDFKLLDEAVKASGFDISTVVSGGARGADTLAELWAKANKKKIKVFKPDWDNLEAKGASIKVNSYGKKYNAKAGFDRNQSIVDYSEGVIALQPNGSTNGTSDTIERAKKKNIPVFIFPEPKPVSEDLGYSYVF